MHKVFLKRLLLFSMLLAVSGAYQPVMSYGDEKADLILTNAAIYTMNASRSWARTLVVKGEKIVFVGTEDGASSFRGEKTRTIDLKGRMVLPGLHDSHVHLIDGGVDLSKCGLSNCKTKEAVLSKIKDYVASHPDKNWIRGGGWSLPVFKDGNPKSQDLDRFCGTKPAFFESQDYHSGWANSKALELAGISKDTPDPDGGRIERDKNGRPSGTLRESAMKLVSNIIPERQPEEYVQGLERAQKLANSYGITSIQDAWTNDNLLRTYQLYDESGKLNVKVTCAPEIKAENAHQQIDELLIKRTKFSGKRVRVTSAKLFADGVIEACTAALLLPYHGHDGDSGKLLFEPEKIKEVVQRLAKEGVQVHIHAIGDRAVRVSLDAFQNALEKEGASDLRHHIAHLEMVDRSDIPRFRQLSVSPNVQSFWAQQDPYIKELTEPYLGKERSKTLYPIGDLAASGAVLVAGSDWPVTTLNPFDAIEVAVRRRELGNTKVPAWLPDQLVDLPTMLAAYTINGAYIQHQDDRTGSLEAGKAADFIVLDQNLFEIPTEKIHDTKVLWTVLDGIEVYRSDSFAL